MASATVCNPGICRVLKTRAAATVDRENEVGTATTTRIAMRPANLRKVLRAAGR
jgi:hypothetical protein